MTTNKTIIQIHEYIIRLSYLKITVIRGAACAAANLLFRNETFVSNWFNMAKASKSFVIKSIKCSDEND